MEPPALLHLLRFATPDNNVYEHLDAGSSASRTDDQSGLESSPPRKTANAKRPLSGVRPTRPSSSKTTTKQAAQDDRDDDAHLPKLAKRHLAE